jgi:hypothetical protein
MITADEKDHPPATPPGDMMSEYRRHHLGKGGRLRRNPQWNVLTKEDPDGQYYSSL